MKSARLPAFNPVEILVILLSGAALAVLLFPVFSQARLKASRGICLTGMKQVLVAAKMYSYDYDGELPTVPGSDANDKEKVVPLQPIGVYH